MRICSPGSLSSWSVRSVEPEARPPLTSQLTWAPEQLCHVELVSISALARKDLNSDAANVKQSGRALRNR
jgi:hypothetical protein